MLFSVAFPIRTLRNSFASGWYLFIIGISYLPTFRAVSRTFVASPQPNVTNMSAISCPEVLCTGLLVTYLTQRRTWKEISSVFTGNATTPRLPETYSRLARLPGGERRQQRYGNSRAISCRSSIGGKHTHTPHTAHAITTGAPAATLRRRHLSCHRTHRHGMAAISAGVIFPGWFYH